MNTACLVSLQYSSVTTGGAISNAEMHVVLKLFVGNWMPAYCRSMCEWSRLRRDVQARGSQKRHNTSFWCSKNRQSPQASVSRQICRLFFCHSHLQMFQRLKSQDCLSAWCLCGSGAASQSLPLLFNSDSNLESSLWRFFAHCSQRLTRLLNVARQQVELFQPFVVHAWADHVSMWAEMLADAGLCVSFSGCNSHSSLHHCCCPSHRSRCFVEAGNFQCWTCRVTPSSSYVPPCHPQTGLNRSRPPISQR